MTSRIRWLRVRNWEHWQSYRKDRGPPPWIKLHRRLLQDMDWSMLSDSEKGHLVSIWILAADRDGLIPGDPRALQRVLGLDAEPDLAKFKELGLIESADGQDGVNVASERRQSDAPEESRGEEETEAEQRRVDTSSAPAGAPAKQSSNSEAFERWWKTLPSEKKVKKRNAYQIWRRKHLDGRADELIADVQNRLANDRRWIEGYIPDPTTYLNQERWNDAVQQPRYERNQNEEAGEEFLRRIGANNA